MISAKVVQEVTEQFVTIARIMSSFNFRREAFSFNQASIPAVAGRWADLYLENKAQIIDTFGGLSVTLENKLTMPKDYAQKELMYVINLCRSYGYFSDALYDGLYRQIFEGGELSEPQTGLTKSGQKIGRYLTQWFTKHVLEERFQDSFFPHASTADIHGMKQSASNGFNTHLSCFLQKIAASGELQLSVAPLDILLMSMHGVTSCMDLGKDYPFGSLSLCLDGHTGIAQILSVTPVSFTIGDVTLDRPKKVWRTMMFLNKDTSTFCLSRQYPYTNVECINQIVKHLQQIYPNARSIPLYNSGIRRQTESSNGFVDDLSTLYTDPTKKVLEIDTKMMGEWSSRGDNFAVRHHFSEMSWDARVPFEDRLEALKARNFDYAYHMLGYFRERIKAQHEQDATPLLMIMAKIPCVECGEFADEGLRCVECKGDTEPESACSICGTATDEHDLTWLDNDGYCERCWADEITYCERCDGARRTDDLVYIKDTESYWCDDCADRHGHFCDGCEDTVANTTVLVTVINYPYWNTPDIMEDISKHSHRHSSFCNSCVENDTFECEDCGELFCFHDLYVHVNGYGEVCPQCLRKRQDEETEDEETEDEKDEG